MSKDRNRSEDSEETAEQKRITLELINKKRMELALQYESEMKRREKECIYEVWRGKKIPINLGIVPKQIDLKRTNSNPKKKRKLLVAGKEYEKVFRPAPAKN